jgi:hypothetical protein
LEDFRALVRLFEREDDAVLLSLGDLFHGPSVPAWVWETDYEHLGDYYADQSAQLFREFSALQRRYPERVACLLGNHEHAHVGGPVLGKFHRDEAAAFEATLSPKDCALLRAFIEGLPWIAVSDAGVAFTHGAPPGTPFDPALLQSAPLTGYEGYSLMEMYEAGFLAELLWRRTSRESEVAAFLEHLNAFPSQPVCEWVTYGHDRVMEGYAIEHPRLLNLSTSFGMHRAQKTYLRLDLSERVQRASDLEEGRHLLPLYPT